jgi:integrase
VNNVDFENRIITVKAAYVKNGESRSVPMNEVLIATLRACSMEVSTPHAPVFCYRPGVPFRGLHTAFTRAVRQAGIADVTFHDLRHTFASRLVMAGVDLTTVKELMGHKTEVADFFQGIENAVCLIL